MDEYKELGDRKCVHLPCINDVNENKYFIPHSVVLGEQTQKISGGI